MAPYRETYVSYSGIFAVKVVDDARPARPGLADL